MTTDLIIRALNNALTVQIPDEELGKSNLESYEIANGMSAIWIDIHEAIRHNKEVIANKEDCMGLSIERETFVLEMIAEELICN